MGRGGKSSGVKVIKNGNADDMKKKLTLLEPLFDPSKCDPTMGLQKCLDIYSSARNFAGYLRELTQISGINDIACDKEAENITKELSENIGINHGNICNKLGPFLDMTCIQTCIITGSNIKPIYEDLVPDNIRKSDEPRGYYIGKLIPGTKIFPFSDFDIVHYYNTLDDKNRGEMLNVLYLLVGESKNVYKYYTRHHFDSSKFAEVIRETIADVKNMPELNRCTRAFKIIEASSDMLNDNFSKYYRSFTRTKNVGDIFTGYISDIAETQAGKVNSASVKREFMEIMKFINARINMSSMGNGEMTKKIKEMHKMANQIMEGFIEEDEEGEGDPAS